jgi:hypothetical protein
MSDKTARKKGRAGLTRRQFSRILAVGAASAALPASATGGSAASAPPNAGSRTGGAELSEEAEAQYKVLISRYGNRLSEEQKADVRRLIDQGLKSTVALRSFHLDNSDEPGNVFRARLIAQE